jgi:hypothetical protein
MTPTHEQLNQVTRLIAETQGYHIREENGCPYPNNGMGSIEEIQRICDATTSLDAIRELVLMENDEFQYEFHKTLGRTPWDKNKYFPHQATAYDWCISYLKAKGKM